jgi:hypothetical protein
MATTKEQEILLAVEVDAATGEVIERPLTDEELAQRKENEAIFKAAEAEAKAKAEARVSALAKLAELGLTEEEIAAL